MIRYQSLDAWRGVACLMIVVLHSWPHPYWGREILRAGVPMFFVISGYCIAATAESSIRRGHGIRQYFGRRLRRIYPPWLIFLALASLFLVTAGQSIIDDKGVRNPRALSGIAWFGNLSLTETWLSTATGRPETFVMGHAWTLCYEEQFYAVVGLLLLWPQQFFRGCMAVTLLTPVAYVLVPRLGGSVRGTFLDLTWLAFASGVWVYHQRVHAPPSRLLGLLPICGMAIAFRHPFEPDWFLLSAFAFAVLLAVLSPHDEQIASKSGLFSKCGLMCYSLYLVHLPVTHYVFTLTAHLGPAATLPLCVAAALMAGTAFHRVVERRFLNRT